MREFPFEALRELKSNWDSYGAVPIDERCIQKAYELWRQLAGDWQATPTSDGCVLLEQHCGGYDIEISIEVADSASVAQENDR